MKTISLLLLLVSAILTLSSCSNNRNLVVLLPDADGKTGQVLVSNAGGSQLLKEPEQATRIESGISSPSAPFTMSKEDLADTFGATLSSLPAPPLVFILYFKQGTSELTQESQALLEKVLPAALVKNSRDISVTGHTDRVGSRQLNYRLGLERANQIRDILISKGIDREYIEATSHGKDNPLISTPDETAEPKNRRVEVIVR